MAGAPYFSLKTVAVACRWLWLAGGCRDCNAPSRDYNFLPELAMNVSQDSQPGRAALSIASTIESNAVDVSLAEQGREGFRTLDTNSTQAGCQVS
jgi:hypothetical protein